MTYYEITYSDLTRYVESLLRAIEPFDPSLPEPQYPACFRVVCVDRAFEASADRKAPFYGTQYSLLRAPESSLGLWRASRPEEEGLFLPSPNPFVTDDFKLLPFSRPHDPPAPQIIRKDPKWTLWVT
jgi:secreted Zn-dependent insulinase-like peptidase